MEYAQKQDSNWVSSSRTHHDIPNRTQITGTFFSNFLKVGRSFSGVRIIRNIDNLKGVQGYGNLLARTSLIIKC